METQIILYFHKNTLTSKLYLLTEKCSVLRESLSEYFYKIQNNGNSENKHFEFILAFDSILVIIRNDASYMTVILI